MLILRRCTGRSRDGLYEPVLADSEREAVADLLQYLENVGIFLIDYRKWAALMFDSVVKPISSPANRSEL